MSNRGRRGGGAAALFASRMTDEVEVTDEERETLGGDPDDSELPDEAYAEDGEDELVAEPSIDHSHEEVEDEPDPEPEPKKTVDAIGDLQRQLAEMQAEREADKAARLIADKTGELRQQQTMLHSGIGRARADLDDATDAYAAAIAAGEHRKAAAIRVKMIEITQDMRDFEVAADEVKAQIARPKTPPVVKPSTHADPFEAGIADISPASQAWCRANKADLTRSQVRANKALVAHQEAVEAGVKVDTPEYFEFLNDAMGYQTVEKPTPKPAKPTGKARVAAPAGGRASPRGDAVDVKLSRDEIQIARSMNMPLKEYAANKAEIIKNAKNPSRGGPVYSAHSAGNRR